MRSYGTPNTEQNAEECDAIDDDSSCEVRLINNSASTLLSLYSYLIHYRHIIGFFKYVVTPLSMNNR